MNRKKITILSVLSLLLFSVTFFIHGRRKKIVPRFEPSQVTPSQATQAQPKPSLDTILPNKITPSLRAELQPSPRLRQTGRRAPRDERGPQALPRKPRAISKANSIEGARPAGPQPAGPKPPKKPIEPVDKKDIFLNFENADLKTFTDYISELKKINVIVDPKIAGNKISLTIRDPLTAEGAWNIFLTVLEMSGFSIVKVGDIHKIIQKKQKLTEPLPTYINVPADTLPDSDLTIRYVTFLTNIPINQVKSLLESMLSQPSKVIPHANANGFVITDKSHNIKSAMKVIQELDRTDVKQSVTVMRLKQANAGDVKKLFDSLMRKPKSSPLARLLGRAPETSVEYFPPTTKIIAEPRTNSLILLGDQKSIKRIEDFVVNHVDKELKGIKSPIHIYELQHTDVDQIKDILETITASKSGSPAAKHGGIRGGVKYFKKMKFAMDKQNNRLLVSSTDEQDWKLLKRTIKDLDKPQPQVALETLIVSVDFTKNKELGSQIRSKKYSHLGHNVNYQAAHQSEVILEKDDAGNPISLLGNLMTAVTAGIGSTVLTFGKAGDIWSMLKMLQTETNVTVLSKPFIVTTNMKEATIQVGETRRVVYQKSIGELQGNIGDASGYEDSTAKLTVKAKPQINLDGIITLGIEVDIKEFKEQDTTKPDTTTKNLKTKVSIANGQVLVLGGFVKTKVSETIYKTPVLGSIPVLGWLFKSKTREVKKEYIFIFMSPNIIKPRTLPGTNLYTKMKLYDAKQDIQDAIEVKKTMDPIHNWFFNPEGETYAHKITDFANARYQPTSVDIIEDPYYRAKTLREEKVEEKVEAKITTVDIHEQSLDTSLTKVGEEVKEAPFVPSDLRSKPVETEPVVTEPEPEDDLDELEDIDDEEFEEEELEDQPLEDKPLEDEPLEGAPLGEEDAGLQEFKEQVLIEEPPQPIEITRAEKRAKLKDLLKQKRRQGTMSLLDGENII